MEQIWGYDAVGKDCSWDIEEDKSDTSEGESGREGTGEDCDDDECWEVDEKSDE